METAKTIPPKGSSEEKMFLKFYLSRYDKKLIIPARDYFNFEKEIELQGHLSSSLKDFMLDKFRGFIAPSNDNKDNEIYDDIIKMVDAHYGTIQFVIVDRPEQYRGRFSIFRDESLVTPMEFMLRMRSEPSMFAFCDEFLHIWWDFKTKNK